MAKNDWSDLLMQAAKLETPEVRRHALVSIRNRHRCQQCFTCACVQTLKLRAEIAKEMGIDPSPFKVEVVIMAKTKAQWQFHGKERFSTEIDYESGVKNVRQVGPRQFQYMEVIDLHSAGCGDAGDKWHVEVTYVDLDAIPEEEQRRARESCGWEGMAIEDGEVQLAALARCCDDYGRHATLWQGAGSNRRNLMRLAYRAADEMLDPHNLDMRLDDTANAIGSTYREMMTGDVYGGLRRGPETPEKTIVGKMLAACEVPCPVCGGTGRIADDVCETCDGKGKGYSSLGGFAKLP